MLYVFGGLADPHVTGFVKRALALGAPCRAVLLRPDEPSSLHWDIDSNRLWIDGEEVRPGAIFLRYDVFLPTLVDRPVGQTFEATAWHSVIRGYAESNADLRYFNRRFGSRATDKPGHLRAAKRLGLRIPRTVISNDREALAALDPQAHIAKPVAGGGYAHVLGEAMGDFPEGAQPFLAPAIVQERLYPDEIRIFLVGEAAHAFRVVSPQLDYRTDQQARLEPIEAPAEVLPGLRALAKEIGLDFCAADFKMVGGSRELCFLEINSQPMFMGFDAAANGALTASMVEWLSLGVGADR